MMDVWPVAVFGPVSSGTHVDMVWVGKEILPSFGKAEWDVPSIMKKFGKPGTVLPR
jgi:hypothetical protein